MRLTMKVNNRNCTFIVWNCRTIHCNSIRIIIKRGKQDNLQIYFRIFIFQLLETLFKIFSGILLEHQLNIRSYFHLYYSNGKSLKIIFQCPLGFETLFYHEKNKVTKHYRI